MLKTDLHLHTADDPIDRIPYTTFQLIDRAAQLCFEAIAITLHDPHIDVGEAADYARARGVVLIPGVERAIGGKHVLLLNFPQAAESVDSFDAVAALKTRHPHGLVIAPHPFFPLASCLRERLDRYADLFDA